MNDSWWNHSTALFHPLKGPVKRGHCCHGTSWITPLTIIYGLNVFQARFNIIPQYLSLFATVTVAAFSSSQTLGTKAVFPPFVFYLITSMLPLKDMKISAWTFLSLTNVNEFKVILGIVIAGPSCYRLSAKDLLELLLNNFATDLNSISSGFSGDKTK